MIKQVTPYDKWPSGDRVHLAVLGFDAQKLHDRYGLEFEGETDDLGDYQLAAIELPDQSQVWLEYREYPLTNQVLVLIDSKASLIYSLYQLTEVLRLELNTDNITWIHPNIRKYM